jgi:hypothetical protein
MYRANSVRMMKQGNKQASQPTGHRHPRCYANADANCSTKISKEHFISASLLRKLELNKKAKIAGLAWQEPEKFDVVPVNGLASNILCERHNGGLSGLDSLIDRFATSIHSFDRVPANKHVKISGSDLERWMLKCLLGMSVSKNFISQLKPECVDLLFGRTHWPEQWGLYFPVTPAPIYHTDSLLIQTRTDAAQSLILAADFFIQGIPFTLLLGKPSGPRAFGIWRPGQLVFKSPLATQVINLVWQDKCSGEAVTLTRTGTYDGHPPNWRDWAKNG